MAAIKTYRPKSVSVTATQTLSNNGGSFTVASNRLSNWNRLVVFGVVKTSAGTNLTNAGVRVYKLSTSTSPLVTSSLITTIFTNTLGEYGVSLKTLTAPEQYAFEAIAPGN